MAWLNLHRLKKEIPLALFFGGLSLLLGLIQFQIPGASGVSTDLREIPLLVSVFYLRSPFSFFLISALTALAALPLEGAHYTTSFLIHFIPLIAAIRFYGFLRRKKVSPLRKGILWGLFTIAYYSLGIIPIGTSIEILFFDFPLGFLEDYVAMIFNFKFEIISSALVSSLFLLQHQVSATLKQTNENLERMVKSRTVELTEVNNALLSLNEELTASNEETRVLNENLEKIVQNRTAKINKQLHLLQKYAHMNSHKVRGPLARILGLIKLINMEHDLSTKLDLINKLNLASEELDEVIKKMNSLLEIELKDDLPGAGG